MEAHGADTLGRGYRGRVAWIMTGETVRVELVESWTQQVLPLAALVLSVFSIGLTLVIRWRDGARVRVETVDRSAVRVANVGRRDAARILEVYMAVRLTPRYPWSRTSRGAAQLEGHGRELPVTLEAGDEVTFRVGLPPWERPELQNGMVEDRDTGEDVRGGVRTVHGVKWGRWRPHVRFTPLDDEGRPDPSE